MEHKRNRKVARLIRRKQRRLANLINYTLVQSYPVTSPEKLRYYQGYHDVACIFMATLGGGTTQQTGKDGIPSDMKSLAAAMGLDLPARVLLQVSQSHLRDFLKSDFKELKTAMELTLFPLIARLDMDVHDFLRDADMQPFFALSWVITWFSHEVRDTELVKRLFDVFLVSHALMPIYLSVAMVLHPVNRLGILQSDPDFGTVHQTLRDLPKNSSMTGWKYRPGDGYVSDDGEAEDEEEDDSLEQAGIAGDFEKIQSELVSSDKQDLNGTQSSVSTCVASMTETQARVPFQEIIDLALDFMRRVPPRKLLPLAVRYYGGPHVASLLAPSQNIRLFSSPFDFAVRSRTTADWVLEQRALKQQSTGESVIPDLEEEEEEPLKSILSRMRDSPAIVALGFSEGEAKSRKRRRRRYIILGALGVAVVAIAVGVAMKQYSSMEGSASDPSEPSGSLVFVEQDVPPPKPPQYDLDLSDSVPVEVSVESTTADSVELQPVIVDVDCSEPTISDSFVSEPVLENEGYDRDVRGEAVDFPGEPSHALATRDETPNRFVFHLLNILKHPMMYKKILIGEVVRSWDKMSSEFYLLKQAGREGKVVLSSLLLRLEQVTREGKVFWKNLKPRVHQLAMQLLQRLVHSGRVLTKVGRALYDTHGERAKPIAMKTLEAFSRMSHAVLLKFREALNQTRAITDKPPQVSLEAVRRASRSFSSNFHQVFERSRELLDRPRVPS